MYKKDNLQTDQLVMNIINIVCILFASEEGIALDVDSYNVIPFGPSDGILEIVQEADTIYHIQSKKKTSILNYILENNGNAKIKDIRTNFIKSTALYCVITYLLGIGDRHLENIMISSKTGRLFHVDFSFIMGKDPVFNNPGIRITSEMIDALGGINSAGYKEFEELSTKIYNCVRRNIEIFVNMLMILPEITDDKITKKEIREQIIKRFIPGENEINAKIHLVAKLEEKSYTDHIKDFCHYHNKENTIPNTLSTVASALTSIFGSK